ncbi:argininosuccinate lyase [Kwoniella sp. DSM 27419]
MDPDDDFTKRKLWGVSRDHPAGRADPLSGMHKFNASIHYTRKLYKVDIRQSIAYSRTLAKAGILNDEDIYTANERRLSESRGAAIGGKLHDGRSRNDQTATDARLWLVGSRTIVTWLTDQLDKAMPFKTYLHDLISVMASRAEKEVDVIMPGYTHLQRAQPVRWSHWLLSLAHSLLADLQRLCHIIPRIPVLPLGSGAMAGNPCELNRAFLARELGFQFVSQNSMYMVWDRDFVMGLLAVEHPLDQLLHSPGRGSDHLLVGRVWLCHPLGRLQDSLELLRGKLGRIFGQMAGWTMSMKGIPTTYNKDMQEDKEPMFDAAMTVQDCVRITEGVIATLDVSGDAAHSTDPVQIRPDKMSAALKTDMLATDLADYLVRKGVSARETHHISDRAVALAEREDKQLSEITFEQYTELDTRFIRDVFDVFDWENSVEKEERDRRTQSEAD